MIYIIVCNPTEQQQRLKLKQPQFFRGLIGGNGYQSTDAIGSAFAFSSIVAAETTATTVFGTVFEWDPNDPNSPKRISGLPDSY